MQVAEGLTQKTLGRRVGRVAAAMLLLVLSPILAIMGFLIWLYDRHSPFFRQVRVGENGEPFRILKFRTMRVDADPYMQKPSDSDPVITPIGRIVRGRAVDELPQLWNVLLGRMALVGPRPEMGFIVEGYNDVERIRLQAKPGLTGLWQLSRVRDRA
ncbi:MAG: sugar transferase, partial [Actinobacteria bacterium]|nr:sugar transferase [Actinomycetota bacterium]